MVIITKLLEAILSFLYFWIWIQKEYSESKSKISIGDWIKANWGRKFKFWRYQRRTKCNRLAWEFSNDDDDDDDNVSVPLNPREKYEDSRDKLLSIEQKVILLEERMEQLENTQKTLRQLITNNCTCIGALLYSWALMKQFILKHKTFLFVTLFLAIVISFIVGLYYVANMSRP